MWNRNLLLLWTSTYGAALPGLRGSVPSSPGPGADPALCQPVGGGPEGGDEAAVMMHYQGTYGGHGNPHRGGYSRGGPPPGTIMPPGAAIAMLDLVIDHTGNLQMSSSKIIVIVLLLGSTI